MHSLIRRLSIILLSSRMGSVLLRPVDLYEAVRRYRIMSIDKETISVRPGEDFDTEKVEHYLRSHIAGLGEGSLQVQQFPSGASNLTYLVKIGDWEGVLRRQPLGPVPPKAHDMLREANLLRRIHPVFPLAPKPYVICTDPNILGVPFYVMERRKGIFINDTFHP